jgi:hypothetical protein
MMGLPVVNLTIDGVQMLAALERDDVEHARRATLHVGAVTSTALLHGLWLLPSGVPVPLQDVPDQKRRRLQEARHFVDVTEAGFERLYSPPGVVRAVAFTGANARRSLERATRFTPIVQRFVVGHRPVGLAAEALRVAEEWGVGVLELDAGTPRALVLPRPAELGVPAVYRWWIAELAYSSWLYESAQPVS